MKLYEKNYLKCALFFSLIGSLFGPLMASTFIPPTDQVVTIGGRYDSKDQNALGFSWNGVYLEININGSGCLVILHEEADSNAYNIFIDGVFSKKLTTKATVDTYLVASGLSAGIHKICVARRIESEKKITYFKGFLLPDGTTATSTSKKTRLIEYIGDSHTAALLAEGTNSNTNQFNNQNAWVSYGAVAARALKADYRLIAVSGKGLIHNWSDSVVFSALPMIEYFKRTNVKDSATFWNYTIDKPDVVVINLGTNDFAPTRSFNAFIPPETTFVSRYKSFLSTIRTVYPNVKIVCIGAYDSCGANEQIQRAVKSVYDSEIALGKTDIAYMPYPKRNAPSNFWCHPITSYHALIADSLVPTLRKITGWDGANIQFDAGNKQYRSSFHKKTTVHFFMNGQFNKKTSANKGLAFFTITGARANPATLKTSTPTAIYFALKEK